MGHGARWTGAVNKGLNDKRLREIILTAGKGNNHTSSTNNLLVKLTIIRWKHDARERIDLHEAYYWMDKQEKIRNNVGERQDLLPTTSTE
jgi:hypothetical protein